MTPLGGRQTRAPDDFDFEEKLASPRVRGVCGGQGVGPSLSRSEELN